MQICNRTNLYVNCFLLDICGSSTSSLLVKHPIWRDQAGEVAVFPVVLEDLLVGHFLKKLGNLGGEDLFQEQFRIGLGLIVIGLFGLFVALHGVSQCWLA